MVKYAALAIVRWLGKVNDDRMSRSRLPSSGAVLGSGAPFGRTRTWASASAMTVTGRSGMAFTWPETPEVSPVKTQRPSSWPGPIE